MRYNIRVFKFLNLVPPCCIGALIILYISFGLFSANQIEQKKYTLPESTLVNHPYISPTPGKFPIIASSPWVDGKPSSKQALENIKECGFNCVLSYVSLSYFNTVSPLLKEVGLRAIIGIPQFSTIKGIEIIDTLKNNPVIGAWRLVDEPKEKDFSKWEMLYNKMLEVDSLHMPYINMVGPEAGKNFLGDCKDFQSFLNEFQSIFKPGVWSYDTYPIYIKDKKTIVNYPIFYEALERYSKISKLTSRPFWAYCQSMAYHSKYVERPEANLSFLSFEAFSALGYGAKGIVYWTYFQRPSTAIETYTSALVDLNGRKSSAWYDAQQINREIETLSEIFLNSEHEETYHTGNSIPSCCKKLNPTMECIKTFKGGNVGFQISRCKSNDSDYLIIINKDVINSQKFSMSLVPDYQVEEMEVNLEDSGNNIKIKKINKRYKGVIQPGRYKIFKYKSTTK